MEIRSFSAYQFRGFKHIDHFVLPRAPLIAIVAPNASGKTNFLEAIGVMLRGKSFRSKLEECVRWGDDECMVQGEISVPEGVTTLAVGYKRQSRKVVIQENGVPTSPVTFFGKYPYVLFLPEDAFLFNRGPSGRRNFLNSSLATSHQYLAHIVQYHRILKQRNAALKKSRSADDVRAWTDLLVEHAAFIWSDRSGFITFLNERLSLMYMSLFGEECAIEVRLVMGAPSSEVLGQMLDESYEYEKKYKHTLYGPHRDDMALFVNGRPIDIAMSRGQIRGVVIALKVITRDYIESLLGHPPVLLFDEVLSELDEQRQQILLSHMPSSQIILTCTHLPESIRTKSDVASIDIRSL